MGIRVVPNEWVPKLVQRQLQPGERRIVTVRQHPAALSLTAVPLLAVAALFSLNAAHVTRGSTRTLAVLGVLLVLCCLLFLFHIVVWLRSFFVLTTERLLIVRRIRNDRVTAVPVAEMGEMTFVRTALGRLWGYGTFRLRRPGSRWRARGAITLRFVPYPEQIYIETAGTVFRDPGQDAY